MFGIIDFGDFAFRGFIFGYSEEERLLQTYNEHFSNKDYCEAIKVLGQIISILPNKHKYYSYRAGLREELRDIKGAINDYTSAIDLSKENNEKQEYLVERGLVKENHQVIKDAIDDYTSAINMSDGFYKLENFVIRGKAKLKVKDKLGAFEDFIDAINLVAEGYVNLNKFEFEDKFKISFEECLNAEDIDKSRFNDLCKKGLEIFSSKIDIYPIIPDFFYYRGILNLTLDNYDAAIQDFSSAIKANPANSNFYLHRASAKINLNNPNGALEDYSLAITYQPKEKNLYEARAKLKSDLGDYQGAIKDYEFLFNLENDYLYLFAIAIEKSASGNHIGTINLLDHIIFKYGNELNNKSIAILLNERALAKSNMSNLKGGLDDYTQAIIEDSECSNAYNSRGLIKEILGDFQGALSDFTAAINYEPSASYYLFCRGQLEYRNIDYIRAFEDFNDAIKLSPKNHKYFYWRGRSRLELKDHEGARKDFLETLELNPDFDSAKRLLRCIEN